ncbi:MAG: NAD-dependent epimerase/dehydratase family protein [Pseudomonadota bacterium]
MKLLITGIAGFIGFHTARRLVEAGHDIVGVDNVNPYYSIDLKRARLAALGDRVQLHEIDIADTAAIHNLICGEVPDVVVHLAAQPGVRYSIQQPFDYASANLVGHLSVLEACRHAKGLSHLVYASSSSVYGETSKAPFSEFEPANEPVSLYGATKRCDELMSSSYAHLYGIRQIGLRFFTVYGSWGRPDMAYWKFAHRMFEGEPIQIFNNGDMRRDMTHIDDVAAGIVAAATRTPEFVAGERTHRIYNVGNSRPERLLDMVETLERLVGKPATKVFEGMQAGDVTETYADIRRFKADYGYDPKTSMKDGLAEFVDWFRDWRARA